MRRVTGWLNSNMALLLVLAIAFTLRVYGNGHGLPDELHADETQIVSRALRFGTGDLNPHFFFYPALYMYVMFFFYSVWFVIGHALGIYRSAAEYGMHYFIDPTVFYLIARTVSAAIGTATIYVVAASGTRFFNRGVGIAAGMMCAVAPLHVGLSHYAVTDVPLTFFFMLSLYFAARLAEDGDRKFYVAAGLAAGLGMASKYTAVLLAPVLLFAHVVYIAGSTGERNPVKYVNKNLILTAVMFAAAFALTSPFCIIDYRTFADDVKIQGELLARGWLGYEEPVNMWLRSITEFLRGGLGLPLLIVSLAGFAYAFVKRTRAGFVFLVFLLIFYVIHGRLSLFGYPRNWVGVVPVMCIFAAMLLDGIAGMIKPFAAQRAGVVFLAAVALMAFPLMDVIETNDVLRRPDTRTMARLWIEKNIEPGTAVAIEFGGPQLKPTPESLLNTERAERFGRQRIDAAAPYNVYTKRAPTPDEIGSQKKKHLAALEKIDKKYDVLNAFSLSEYPLELYMQEGFEYLVVSSHIYDRYFNAEEWYPEAVSFYRSLDTRALMVKEFEAAPSFVPGPTIRIYYLSSLSNNR